MRSNLWRWLMIGGLSGGLLAGVGCSSGDDDGAAGGGNKPSTGGTGGLGGAGGASAGTGAAGRAPTAGGGAGGSAAGVAGTPSAGGSAGTPASGGAPIGGGAGTSGAAGAVASGGAPATGGMAGSGGGTAGNGAGGMAVTLVTPIMKSATKYVLEFGDTYLEVNPMLGARVVDLHLKGGTNLLVSGTGDNIGSTFWPSPQAAWTWPPTDAASITNINDKPYTASDDATSMTFVGTSSTAVGISVTKKFAVDLAKEAVVVTYSMIGTAADKSVAPWEITRFPQAGVTFWPTGTAPVAANGMELPATAAVMGHTWLTAPTALPANDQKLNADGTGGWLAHAAGDWVVVKKFTDMAAGSPPAATGEAEIQVYLSKASSYMEVEVQGPYAAVPMGQTVTYSVTWFVRKLPAGAMPVAGNQALVDFVKSLVE